MFIQLSFAFVLSACNYPDIFVILSCEYMNFQHHVSKEIQHHEADSMKCSAIVILNTVLSLYSEDVYDFQIATNRVSLFLRSVQLIAKVFSLRNVSIK